MATAQASFVSSFPSSWVGRLVSFLPPMVCVVGWKFHPTGSAPTVHRNWFASTPVSQSPRRPRRQPNWLLPPEPGKRVLIRPSSPPPDWRRVGAAYLAMSWTCHRVRAAYHHVLGGGVLWSCLFNVRFRVVVWSEVLPSRLRQAPVVAFLRPI